MIESIILSEKDITLMIGYGLSEKNIVYNLSDNLKNEFNIAIFSYPDKIGTVEAVMLKKNEDLTIDLLIDEHKELNTFLIIFGADYSVVKEYFGKIAKDINTSNSEIAKNNVVKIAEEFLSVIKLKRGYEPRE